MDWAPVWNTYVRVEDAGVSAAKVTEAGGKVTMEPFEVGPAGRVAAFDDPEGAALCLWEPGQNRGAQLVNDPGAWVFSGLNTGDPQGAEAFYGSVFGWEMGAADESGSSMIRKPGTSSSSPSATPACPRGWSASRRQRGSAMWSRLGRSSPETRLRIGT